MEGNKIIIELNELEYIQLNEIINKDKKFEKLHNLKWNKGLKVVPIDTSNLDRDYDEKVMLVYLYYNDPADLFTLGKRTGIKVSQSRKSD